MEKKITEVAVWIELVPYRPWSFLDWFGSILRLKVQVAKELSLFN